MVQPYIKWWWSVEKKKSKTDLSNRKLMRMKNFGMHLEKETKEDRQEEPKWKKEVYGLTNKKQKRCTKNITFMLQKKNRTEKIMMAIK